MPRVLLLLLMMIAGVQHGKAQVNVTVHLIAPDEILKDSVFIAGNFNGWNPAAIACRFTTRNGIANQGVLSFQLPGPGDIEYKITRGSWNKVECTAAGGDIQNRVFTVQRDTTITVRVAGWKDRVVPKPLKSTASKQVRLVDPAFAVPQLGRKRTVRIYLPKDYLTSRKKYAVLYMHDGQNLFDAALNPFGEWGVDECLDSARRKCIIVGIDHGGDRRLTEYNPYTNVQFGAGEGEAYARFLVETLKPMIDKRYRTLSGPANTYIAGSSMGGLISWYTALKYPGVFGKAGVFSPAFWIAGGATEGDIQNAAPRRGQHYYFYAGQQESENMVTDMVRVFGAMQQKLPTNNFKVSIKAEGKHNEAAWRQELPAFFEWLFR